MKTVFELGLRRVIEVAASPTASAEEKSAAAAESPLKGLELERAARLAIIGATRVIVTVRCAPMGWKKGGVRC